MPPKKAHRAESDCPVLAELAVCKAAVAKRDAGQSLARLRAAFTALCALPPKKRGVLTSFTPGLVASVLYAALSVNDATAVQAARASIIAMYPLSIVASTEAAGADVPRLPFDERVATLCLRVLHKAGEPRGSLLSILRKILETLSSGSKEAAPIKRRLYAPLLEACATSGDADLAVSILQEARSRGLQLRDVDYETALEAASLAVKQDSERKLWGSHIAARVVGLAADTQPIVGGRVAELLQTLLDATVVDGQGPSLTGKCIASNGQFGTFGFDERERESLLQDIIDKLVRPHCARRVDAHPEDSSARRAFDNFLAFKTQVDTLVDVPAVVDGANVGFFGLSSWYESAKRAALDAKGVDASEVDSAEFVSGTLKKKGVATDVSPNFEVIDAAVKEYAQQHTKNHTPVIFLHERHFSAQSLGSGANGKIFSEWKARGVRVLATPNHINDDLCWMYAALRHRCAVISNDQMRDHHFGLLAPRDFLKWRVTNQLKYTCHFAPGTIKVRLRKPPPCVTWPSLVFGSSKEPNAHGAPGGIHVPFTRKQLVEDAGKIYPGSPHQLPPNALLLPQSPADLVDQAPQWCDGWLYAPVPEGFVA